MGQANHLARIMGWFFASYDVLLTPTLGRLPAPLKMYDPTEPVELRRMFETWSPWESFLPVFNATGQPAISLPLHMSESGLPIGMQLVGGFGARVVAAAPVGAAGGGPALVRANPTDPRQPLTVSGRRDDCGRDLCGRSGVH